MAVASATGFPNQILSTVSGTLTAFLPITTPWPAIQSCSSQIYGLADYRNIAFDPYYGLNISPNAPTPCLPPEVTASWNQPSGQLPRYALGPTFVCPGAYYPVSTNVINSETQQVLCCPSYVVPAPKPVPQRLIFHAQILHSQHRPDDKTAFSRSMRLHHDQRPSSHLPVIHKRSLGMDI